MKDLLGGLCFAITAAFAAGLLLGLDRYVVGNGSGTDGLIAFFGFGIPMLLAGAGTESLWLNSKGLTKLFGWACTAAGLAWGVKLFMIVGGWVGILPANGVLELGPRVLVFAAYGMLMFTCLRVGIVVLTERPGGSS